MDGVPAHGILPMLWVLLQLFTYYVDFRWITGCHSPDGFTQDVRWRSRRTARCVRIDATYSYQDLQDPLTFQDTPSFLPKVMSGGFARRPWGRCVSRPTLRQDGSSTSLDVFIPQKETLAPGLNGVGHRDAGSQGGTGLVWVDEGVGCLPHLGYPPHQWHACSGSSPDLTGPSRCSSERICVLTE